MLITCRGCYQNKIQESASCWFYYTIYYTVQHYVVTLHCHLSLVRDCILCYILCSDFFVWFDLNRSR